MGQFSDKKCIAIGPGLGTADGTKALVRRIIKESRIPVVVDADGLNCLVGHTRILKKLNAPVIVTPHPGEMARLMETTTRFVQKDRIACARDFAKKIDAHVVLKGARTVIAHPDGSVYINPTGNSGMASGGMGDVLTGMIAGLVTQGQSIESAAHSGVYLHGAVADVLSKRMGPFGFLAGDVMNAIPEQISHLLNND
jgi:NAD(P)H-hydrate epimerase